jgi:hypothetical protein
MLLSAISVIGERQRTIANANLVEASLLPSYLLAGAANEGAARLKETQQPAYLTRDANAHSCANLRSFSNRGPKPKRTVGTQVNSVQPLVDLQCRCKPSWPSRQICEFVGSAEPFHQVDSFKRLNSTQQHSRAKPRFFSRYVEHV